MKIAVYILTIYMLALALIPCGDGGGGIVEIVHELMGTEHHDSEDHEQHSNNCEDDHCSPLCICNCCSSVFDPSEKEQVALKVPNWVFLETPIFTDQVKLSNYADSIWQPPRCS
jgi:hypothetical protein